jgi:membrane-bound metal-dependent hydrolase YbcI (DUF457 family)
MPYTPIHSSVAYLARQLIPKLSLPALLVSTMAPDLEIPLIYAATSGQYSRLVLHSLLGAITLATTLSVVLVAFAYPPVVSYLFKIDIKTIKDRCRLSWSLVAICLVGGISHVLIDSLHHRYNPLFYPFTYSSYDAFVFMNDWALASVVIPIAFLSLLVLFVAREIKKGTKDIWKRLLVE